MVEKKLGRPKKELESDESKALEVSKEIKAESETIEEVMPKQEQFISPDELEEREEIGWKKAELNDRSGYSLPANIREDFIKNTKEGELIYIVR